MTEAPCPTVLKYQRSSYTSNAIVFDADLNLHSLEQLRELARDGVQLSIVDVETEERAGSGNLNRTISGISA
jgi:hypothetical protein